MLRKRSSHTRTSQTPFAKCTCARPFCRELRSLSVHLTYAHFANFVREVYVRSAVLPRTSFALRPSSQRSSKLRFVSRCEDARRLRRQNGSRLARKKEHRVFAVLRSWATRIRTLKMTESESVALPFGDSPRMLPFRQQSLLYTNLQKFASILRKILHIFL